MPRSHAPQSRTTPPIPSLSLSLSAHPSRPEKDSHPDLGLPKTSSCLCNTPRRAEASSPYFFGGFFSCHFPFFFPPHPSSIITLAERPEWGRTPKTSGRASGKLTGQLFTGQGVSRWPQAAEWGGRAVGCFGFDWATCSVHAKQAPPARLKFNLSSPGTEIRLAW